MERTILSICLHLLQRKTQYAIFQVKGWALQHLLVYRRYLWPDFFIAARNGQLLVTSIGAVDARLLCRAGHVNVCRTSHLKAHHALHCRVREIRALLPVAETFKWLRTEINLGWRLKDGVPAPNPFSSLMFATLVLSDGDNSQMTHGSNSHTRGEWLKLLSVQKNWPQQFLHYLLDHALSPIPPRIQRIVNTIEQEWLQWGKGAKTWGAHMENSCPLVYLWSWRDPSFPAWRVVLE